MIRTTPSNRNKAIFTINQPLKRNRTAGLDGLPASPCYLFKMLVSIIRKSWEHEIVFNEQKKVVKIPKKRIRVERIN